MKTNNNYLKFAADGKSVQIIFADGKESFDLDTKNEALNAILTCSRKKKITLEELKEMAIQIIEKEELSWGASGPFSLFSSSLFMGTHIELSVFKSESDEPTTVARFEPCDCGQRHGQIYFKGGMTGVFESVNMGALYLEILVDKKEIDTVEQKKTMEEIKNFFAVKKQVFN